MLINQNSQGEYDFGAVCGPGRAMAPEADDKSAEGTTEPEDADTGLQDVARTEREYVRRRLREELEREPTEEEMDEWLRQQTEGH